MAPKYIPTHIPYGMIDPARRVIRNPGVKDECKYEKYGIETGGTHFYMVNLLKGGGGVPIHRHDTYGETMYPVKGELGVVGHNGTKTIILHPPSSGLVSDCKESYAVKPGEWHRFFNPSPDAEIVFEARVAPAHLGFEKLLSIYYGIVSDGHGDEIGAVANMFHALMLMNMGGMGYPGWGGWFSGLLASTVGWIARVTGEEERLTRKYYGRPITAEELKEFQSTGQVTLKKDI